MSLATTYCRAQLGTDAPLVTIETHLSNGLPGFNIVGLAETSVKESKDRVRSALINAHFEFPQRRITVNLAPADLPKQGGRYDLAIAIGILCASDQIPCEALEGIELYGELSLSGGLRAIPALLPAIVKSKNHNSGAIVPADSQQQVSITAHHQLYMANHLLEVSAHLLGRSALNSIQAQTPEKRASDTNTNLASVIGQTRAKRALIIAAAGRHHALMAGPPGSGKTLLASCMPSIMPNMSLDEAIETACIHSLQNSNFTVSLNRPFCAPHHSASGPALVGGGNPPKPGEISRAHNGVLFLDEIPEFSRKTLENLREPLESGHITISRAAQQVTFDSKFLLIAAMNCCPCGYYLSETTCRCTPDQIQRYQHKLSGPLLDRIDIHLFIKPTPFKLQQENKTPLMTSEQAKHIVSEARALQIKRQQCLNSQLNNQSIAKHCSLLKTDEDWLIEIMESLKLSMRSYHRILKVARTIADLSKSDNIQKKHLQEALSLRQKIDQNST